MKKILILSIALASGTVAFAQERGRVISASPIKEQYSFPEQVCQDRVIEQYSSSGSGVGAIVGAVAGGVIANQFGGGGGRAALTAGGAVAGGMLGNSIESSGSRNYQVVKDCRTQIFHGVRNSGYNVSYEYGGRQYTTVTQDHPGQWIALNVQPQVQYQSAPVYQQPQYQYQQPHYQYQQPVTQTYHSPRTTYSTSDYVVPVLGAALLGAGIYHISKGPSYHGPRYHGHRYAPPRGHHHGRHHGYRR